MRHPSKFTPQELTSFFAHLGPLGPRFSWQMAPKTAPQSVEETWIVRARPLGSSGRMEVEARPHRRSAWIADPEQWPQAVREMAKARLDKKGRSVSRRPYTEWVSLSGAKAKARRAVEVVLRAVRTLVAPLVRWMEATIETSFCTMRVRVRENAPLADRLAFLKSIEYHVQAG